MSTVRGEALRVPGVPWGYRLSLAAFVLFTALSLLAIVDFRRGFLFTTATGFGGYLAKSPYFVFSPWQGLMLLVGLVGLVACYRNLREYEAELGSVDLGGYLRWLAFLLFGILVVDLFTYRGVPAIRAATAGTISAGWLEAYGITGWLRPLALTLSYMLNVWHATLLGILLAGLALTVLPRYMKSFFAKRGLRGSLFGAAFALPQPFCSCCASVICPSLVRQGASSSFALAFVVGSPMLNITALILAALLLPPLHALTRIVAGVVLTVLVTWLVVRLAEGWRDDEGMVESPLARWISRGIDLYSRVFQLEKLVAERPLDSPAAFVSAWVYVSGRMALVLVPTLAIWSLMTAAIVQVLPSAFGNNPLSIVVAAVAGTLLMISTWTEIPVALQMIQAGYSGPAATLLVVLPPVSLPCLLILGGATRRFRLVALLGLAVMVVGIAAGIIFL